MKRSGLLGVTLLMVGCAAGPNVDLPTAASADSTATFHIFQGSRTVTLDHLRLSNDSAMGLAVRPHPNAVQVPVAIPLTEIDSVKRTYPDRNGFLLFMTPVAIVMGLFMMLSASFPD